MRLGLLLVCGMSVVILSGCMPSKESSSADVLPVPTVDTVQKTSTVAWTSEGVLYTTIPACVSYVKTIMCMNAQWNEKRQKQWADMLNKVLQARKTLNAEQLRVTCEASKNILAENKKTIEKSGCTL